MKRCRDFIIYILILLSLFSCQTPKNSRESNPDEVFEVIKRYNLGGAPVHLNVKLSKKSIDLTEFLKVVVEIEFTEETQIIPPFLPESVYYPLLLVENPENTTQWSDNRDFLISRWIYQFEPLKSGDFTLKPFSLFFRLKKEKNSDPDKWPIYQINTESIPYQVSSVEISETDDIRDIKGLILPEYRYAPILISGGCLLFIIICYVLIKWYRQNQNPESKKTKSKADFYELTLHKLDDLEAQNLISKNEFNQLHTQLSTILRYFIENHFGLRAQEQTTEEFMKEMQQSIHFNNEQRGILIHFLKLADLVKFATFDPGSQISQDAMLSIRDFVIATGRQNEV